MSLHACPVRRVVDDAVQRLTASENPTLISHLSAFLQGKSTAALMGGGGGGSSAVAGPKSLSNAAAVDNDDNEDNDGAEMLRRVQQQQVQGPDPSLMCCGFTPVALVTEALTAGSNGAGGGTSRFDHQYFMSASSSTAAVANSNNNSGGAAALAALSSSTLLSSGGGGGNSSSSETAAAITANTNDIAAFAASFSVIVNTSSDADIAKFSTIVMSTVKARVKQFATRVMEAERQDCLGWTAPSVADMNGGADDDDDDDGMGSSASMGGGGDNPKAKEISQQVRQMEKELQHAQNQSNRRRSAALRRRRDAPILIICRCIDNGSTTTAAQRLAASAAGGGGGGGANAATVRRIALGMAQTVTRIVLATEAAAAAGRALSFAAVGDEECCPLVSVLVVSSSDSAAVPFISGMIRQHCLGSQLQVFNGKGRLTAAGNNTSNSNTAADATPSSSTAAAVHPSSSSAISSSASSDLIPLPVARFLYEVIPHIPVVLTPQGLTRLLAAWYASLRLSDVGAMFIAMVMPFRLLRRYMAATAPSSAADDTATTTDDDARARGQKHSPASRSRTDQFTANIELIQLLLDHCTVIECLAPQQSSNTGHTTTPTITATATAPTPMSFAAARAFGALYGSICRGDWGSIGRANLWAIVSRAEREGMLLSASASSSSPLLTNELYDASSPSFCPSATKLFIQMKGAVVVEHYKRSVVALDISHILVFSATFPTYFPALSAPKISFSNELVRNLLNKVSIVVANAPSTARKTGDDADDDDGDDAGGSSSFLDEASRLLAPPPPPPSATNATFSRLNNRNSAAANSNTNGPQMAFSDEFFSSAVSDAVRILYVLVCHELQASSGMGGGSSTSAAAASGVGGGGGAWVPLSHICIMCCFGDELRCLRALHHLSLCRVIVVRPAKGDVRSKCLA